MRSKFLKSDGLDAIFKSARHQFFSNSILIFPTFVYEYRSDLNGHRESCEIICVNLIVRKNEDTGRLVMFPTGASFN
jgi:hypothetical protein